MNTSKEHTVNKLLLLKQLKSNKLAIPLTVLLLSACAETSIVTMETPVKQLHNLKDYDSDGVIKAREKCDGTPLGALIDNYGCGEKITKIAPLKIDIKFENSSYVIPQSAYSEITKLAEFLRSHPGIDVVIEGHSSKVGAKKYNKKLSKNRAQAVELMLINDFNINKSRVSSIGYGFERLEVEGESEQAHAANRRIMVESAHTEKFDKLKWTIYTVDREN